MLARENDVRVLNTNRAHYKILMVNRVDLGVDGVDLLAQLKPPRDGLGRLGYEAVKARDYPIVFATLYIFGLIGLLLQLVSDLTYTAVDPRIDFESREV